MTCVHQEQLWGAREPCHGAVRCSRQEKSPDWLQSTTESPEVEKAPGALAVPSRQLAQVQG